MIAVLFLNELRKTRRSLALLLMVACPLVVVMFNTAMLLNSGGRAAKMGMWDGFWLGNFALWCYFMLPMYIALATAFLSGGEHRNHTWRLVFTMPVSPYQVYLAKALLAYAFVAGATLVLYLMTLLAVLFISLFGYPMAGAFSFAAAPFMLRIGIGCLPILIIHHILSWRFSNMVLPLAAGVFGTLGVMQLGASKYWVYWPWAYTMMASNGPDAAMQNKAMLIAAALAALLYGVSALLFARRNLSR